MLVAACERELTHKDDGSNDLNRFVMVIVGNNF